MPIPSFFRRNASSNTAVTSKTEGSPVLPPLKNFGRKVTSQTDEDGIIEKIFSVVAPRSRTFLKFGIGPNYEDPDYKNGLEGNCVQLLNRGWRGVFLDGGAHPKKYGVKQKFITPLNINSVLDEHGMTECDVLSIDVDGQDFWIWMAVASRPSLVIVEYNPNWKDLNEKKTVPYDPSFRWDGTKYYGASLGALVSLGVDRGYTLIYANGLNAFFLRKDLFSNHSDFDPKALNRVHDQHAEDQMKRPWISV